LGLEMIGQTILLDKSQNHPRVLFMSAGDLADPNESVLADEEGTPS
jgi:hypothetical protein